MCDLGWGRLSNEGKVKELSTKELKALVQEAVEEALFELREEVKSGLSAPLNASSRESAVYPRKR